ncbi:hypothetical protein [Anaerotignum propionicum]|uniref:hypothetical protein n=1 Tax=Anaerotignum propionicum TaxID=28446 RepID=UPI00289F0FEA|nr:hypothetical protein [Anaerotignum propionicum]
MGNFSKIEHDFWQDDFVLNLTPEERYFYLYLLSNGRTNALGCYELRMRMAEVETGYNADTIKKYLNKFVSSGKILFDFDTQEVLIVNWYKYNWTKKTGNINSILKDFKAVKSLTFKGILENSMVAAGIKKTNDETENLETTGNNEEQQETKGETCTVDIDIDTDIDIDFKKDMAEVGLEEPKEKTSSDQDRFDQFWKLYPNKKAKAAAFRRWRAMKISVETFQVILDGLQKALRSQEWAKDGGAYIPHPATWLNGGCWEDEYKPLAAGGSRPDKPTDSAIDRRRQMMGIGDKNG